MKPFQEFVQEKLLEIAKTSTSPLLELCGHSNSLSNAVSYLIENYGTYLKSVQKSFENSLTVYDKEIAELSIKIETFEKKDTEEKFKIIKEELKITKDIILKLVTDSESSIKRATQIKEEIEVSKNTGLKKEAENIISQIAKAEIESGSARLKYYIEQTKPIIGDTTDNQILDAIVTKKTQFLKVEHEYLLSQKQKAINNLEAIKLIIENLDIKR